MVKVTMVVRGWPNRPISRVVCVDVSEKATDSDRGDRGGVLYARMQ